MNPTPHFPSVFDECMIKLSQKNDFSLFFYDFSVLGVFEKSLDLLCLHAHKLTFNFELKDLILDYTDENDKAVNYLSG